MGHNPIFKLTPYISDRKLIKTCVLKIKRELFVYGRLGAQIQGKLTDPGRIA